MGKLGALGEIIFTLGIWQGILIHTLELNFEVSLFVQGSHTFATFMSMRYVIKINREYPSCMCTYYTDDLYPIWSELEYRLSACKIWLYYASSSTMWWFLDNVFCLVCGLLEKKVLLAPGYPCHISLETARKWLHQLGFKIVDHNKGVMGMNDQVLSSINSSS